MTERVVDANQLKTLDAIQLATALLIAESNGQTKLSFIASDGKLLQAAQVSGLVIINPEQTM